jgi:endonuclease/exonuclease/phosphatase (EEP) superfamily protein YafD
VRSKGRLRRAIAFLAHGYTIALAALLLALYAFGENWWVTTALLYVPRVAFVAPVPLLVLLIVIGGQRRFLWTQLVAILLVAFPLMGLTLPWPAAPAPSGRSFKLLSFNVNSGFSGPSQIVAQITQALPDVVLIQEGQFNGGELSERLRAFYPYVQASNQFTIASRYRIVETTEQPMLPYYGRQRHARFMRYLLDTPLGPIAFYNIHPISPRGALHVHRFRDAFHLLRTGALLAGDPEKDLGSNTGLRALQIAAVAEFAAREHVPVLIAGDTNLPTLSSIFRKNLSGYTDAFQAASSGFGYSFPSKHPFLRLDRILSGPELRFTSFRVGCEGVSDHLCIAAEIERQR